MSTPSSIAYMNPKGQLLSILTGEVVKGHPVPGSFPGSKRIPIERFTKKETYEIARKIVSLVQKNPTLEIHLKVDVYLDHVKPVIFSWRDPRWDEQLLVKEGCIKMTFPTSLLIQKVSDDPLKYDFATIDYYAVHLYSRINDAKERLYYELEDYGNKRRDGSLDWGG